MDAGRHLLLLLLVVVNSLPSSCLPCGNSETVSRALSHLSATVWGREGGGWRPGGGGGGGPPRPPPQHCDSTFTCPSPLAQLARSLVASERGSAHDRGQQKAMKEALPGMVVAGRGRPGLLGLLLLWLRSSGEPRVVGERAGERAARRGERGKVDVLEVVRRGVDVERKWLRTHACPRSSPYAVSVSLLAVCVSESPVDSVVVSALIEESRDNFAGCAGDTHSTMAVAAMLFACVTAHSSARAEFSEKLSLDAGRAARESLRRLAREEEGGAASVYATALAMQALRTGELLLGFSPPGWDCAASERALVTATLTGEMENPAAAAHALLALSGSSLYHVGARHHHHHHHHHHRQQETAGTIADGGEAGPEAGPGKEPEAGPRPVGQDPEAGPRPAGEEPEAGPRPVGGAPRRGEEPEAGPRPAGEELEAEPEAGLEAELLVVHPWGRRSERLRLPHGATLLVAMETASMLDPIAFRFDWVPTIWGPYVTSVGGVSADPDLGSYWRILGPSGVPTQQGVKDISLHSGDTVTLEFVQP